MTGDHFSAQEAKEYGLIYKEVSPVNLMEEAYAVARRIQGNAPLGVRMIKRLLHRQGAKHSEDVVSFLPTLFLTGNFVEARRASAEKRSSNFKPNYAELVDRFFKVLLCLSHIKKLHFLSLALI